MASSTTAGSPVASSTRRLGVAGFVQALALDLVEVGIVGEIGDQAVDGLFEFIHADKLEIGDRAGVTGGDAGVFRLVRA